MATDDTLFPDGYQDFDGEAKKLARKRLIAEQLLARPDRERGEMMGKIYVPNYGGMASDFIDRTSANKEIRELDAQDKLLSANQARNTRQVVEGLSKRGQTPGIVQGEGPLLEPNIDPNRMVDLNPADEANRRLKIMGQGMGNPTLRQTLQAQIGQEMDYPEQQRVRQENATQRAHERALASDERKAAREDTQAFQAEQNKLYRANPLDLRRTIVEAADNKASEAAAAKKRELDDAENARRTSVDSFLDLATKGGADGKTPALLDIATSSGIGNVLDKAGNLIGVSSQSADAAAQLRAIEGALVSKMPKMSGPQSDKDVLLYRQMAGQIGDATLPVSQRKKAAETVRMLNQKYSGLQGNIDIQPGATPTVVRTGTRKDGTKVQQMSDGSVREVR